MSQFRTSACSAPGSIASYGTGLPGLFGGPQLVANKPPTLGQEVLITVGDSSSLNALAGVVA